MDFGRICAGDALITDCINAQTKGLLFKDF